MGSGGAMIRGVGMMTSVGVGAGQTCSSVRSGVARLAESPIAQARLHPLVMGLLPEPELPPLAAAVAKHTRLTTRQMRMLRLGGAALAEAVADAGDLSRVPAFVGVPAVRHGERESVGANFVELLALQAGLRLAVGTSRVFPLGRAAGLMAIDAALRSIARGEHERVIAGGVDTYLDLVVLAGLESEGRLRVEGNADGFIPGEGAGFLLLSAAATGVSAKGARGRILASACGVEDGHRYSEAPLRGDGLAATIRTAVEEAGTKSGALRTVLAGFNGESLEAKEWGTAFARAQSYFADDCVIEHPVDCFGDPGAALGPVLTGIAAMGLQDGAWRGDVLVWCASDLEQRAALILEAS